MKAEPVLLLHGLMMRSPALLPLASRLRRRGFEPRLFGYSTLWQSPARAMERLAMQLYAYGDQPVHLVAHSLGGLVALETINRYQQLPPGRVTCLGSPLAGSTAARALHDRGLGFVSGKSGAFLRGGLIELPPRRQIGVIAGSRSLGLGKYFSRFDGLNDGTVAVWETRLPGLADHIVIPSSHTGLAFSPVAADLVGNFLETGHFRP
ncbi:MAG TPA: alpha/beta fold hydrolase [Arenimonas sp.]|uniref:esterase/lipase family protein n=1 Tax=Arenimonas sp. TaxID=1872635 RepID=UPI002C1866A4|nr:alpha/beta fold hydrolase [Arenimonas sp.]HMB58136.1 alpha/beta fold hydrolase [Arenimonas sp.]